MPYPHKRHLDLDVIDLSQVSFWRARLFHAPVGQEFPLDGGHLEGVPKRLANTLRRCRLAYDVARVDASEAEP